LVAAAYNPAIHAWTSLRQNRQVFGPNLIGRGIPGVFRSTNL